ncbi:MAG: aminoglycoside phosphotransferase family protein, partial [Planctomycetia bacterium]
MLPNVTTLLESSGLGLPRAIERLPGGGNNRVYRVDTPAGPVLLKEYFRHAGDPRDRLGAEQAFLQFAWAHGVRAIPQPLACDRGAGIGIYEFVAGRKLAPGEVTAAHVDEAAAFFAAVNRHRHDPDAATLPVASEACFSLAEHLACVDRRLTRLGEIEPESDLHREAAALVASRLVPAWQRVRAAVAAGGLPIDEPLAAEARVISPSDFGFHNCIATDSGLKFIDFEYAGWDDPAKLACDFFCQPRVPVPGVYWTEFVRGLDRALGWEGRLEARARLLLPAYRLKWCCIILNEFLRADRARREF